MASPTLTLSPYDLRVKLVKDTITAHSKIGDEAAGELATRVLHAPRIQSPRRSADRIPTPDRTSGHQLAIADIAAYTHLTEADIEALGTSSTPSGATSRNLSVSETRPTSGAPSTSSGRSSGVAPDHRLQPVAARLDTGHRVAGLREMHREHGDRPQRRPRPVGLDERPRDPLHHLGVGHGRASRRSGGTRTTTAITCSATSSVSTTISASASSGSPATRRGNPSTCFSRSETCCWPPSSNGASDFTAFIPSGIGWRRTPPWWRARRALVGKIARQTVKDYVLFPALSRSRMAKNVGQT